MSDHEHSAARVEAGLPVEPLLDRRLVFDAPTQTVILSGVAKRKGAMPQLYWRRLADSMYTSIVDQYREEIEGGVELRGERAEYVVDTWTMSLASTLFCVVLEIEPPNGTRVRVMRCCGLLRLDLCTKQSAVWSAQSGELSDLVLSELVGPGETPDQVHAIVGYPTAERMGPVSYHVACLDFSARTVAKIGDFSRVYF